MVKNLGMTDAENREANNWFRSRGVPLVIRKRQRLVEIIPRSIPVTAWLILSTLSYGIAWVLLSLLNEDSTGNPVEALGISEDAFFLTVLGASFIAPLVFLVVPWLLRRVLKKVSRKVQYPLGILLLLGMLIIFSTGITETSGKYGFAYFKTPFEGLILTALVLVALFYELDSVIIWAAKRTLHELWSLAPMLVKVLPVLMIAILFTYVSEDIWHIADELSLLRTWEVVGVLLLLALFVATTTSIEGTKRLLEARKNEEPQEENNKDLLEKAGSPWDTLAKSMPDGILNRGRSSLSKGEWINFISLPILNQMIQALLFLVALFIFFLWFGYFAIPLETISGWLHKPLANLQILGLTIPVSSVFVKVSMIMAAFSSLSFVATTATDDKYAKEFLEPMMGYLEEIVVVRNIYLAKHDAQSQENHDSGNNKI